MCCQIVPDVSLQLNDCFDELRIARDYPYSTASQGLEDVVAGIEDLSCSY